MHETLLTRRGRPAVSACLAVITVALAAPGVRADPGPPAVPLNALEGRVLDADGKTPLPDVSVTAVDARNGVMHYTGPEDVSVYAPAEKLFLFLPKRNGLRNGVATTDAQGRFTIKGMKRGAYHVLAVHKMRGIAIAAAVAQPNAGKPVEITLSPPTFIDGSLPWLATEGGETSVTLQYRSPIPGMPDPAGESEMHTVTAPGVSDVSKGFPTHIGMAPTAMLDKDGHFHIGPLLAAEDCVLDVQRFIPVRGFSAGLLRTSVKLETGKTTTLAIDPDKGETLASHVSGPKGEALENVAVSIAPKKLSGRETTLYGAVTDAKGKYLIRGVPPGEYVLTAERRIKRTGFG